ncbi:MAG: PD40 domain-containing protein [Acidobacteriaceae bacterium]|nr:PD40 domain-containing protein [Acidobacteriaceae bacterium]
MAAAVIYRMTAVRSRGALESRIFPFTTYPGGEYEPKFSPDGSWIAFIWNKENESAAHLYIKSVKTGELRRVTSGLRAGYWGYWTLDRNSIYFLEPEASGRSALERYSLASGNIGLLAMISTQPPFGDSGLSVTRDGREFLFNQVDHSSSDILLAKNFF